MFWSFFIKWRRCCALHFQDCYNNILFYMSICMEYKCIKYRKLYILFVLGWIYFCAKWIIYYTKRFFSILLRLIKNVNLIHSNLYMVGWKTKCSMFKAFWYIIVGIRAHGGKNVFFLDMKWIFFLVLLCCRKV